MEPKSGQTAESSGSDNENHQKPMDSSSNHAGDCDPQPANLNQPDKASQGLQADAEKQAKADKSIKKWRCRLRFLFCCLGYQKNKVSTYSRASG